MHRLKSNRFPLPILLDASLDTHLNAPKVLGAKGNERSYDQRPSRSRLAVGSGLQRFRNAPRAKHCSPRW